MDLLNENHAQEQKPIKGKKTVLTLLILSIVFAILIIAVMIFISANKEKKDIIIVNGQSQEIKGDFIVADTNNTKYISLKQLADLVGYRYDNSEYKNYGYDTTKCHIKDGTLISGFELDSNKIYKYEEGTNLDYQYYTLKYNIMTYKDQMYIALADLQTALNIYCTTDQNNNITISTIEYLSLEYQKELKTLGYDVTTEPNNQKALAYGWIIANKGGEWTVLNTKFEEILGSTYASIYFDEYNKNYIVSNNNGQYGIISSTCSIEKNLKYDNLEILNYQNMLYKVENNNKYGIIRKDGSSLTNGIIYDQIGYKAEPSNKILYTLIIPALDEETPETIVVKQNGKYGLISLKTGETFLPCDHLDKLYSIDDLGVTYYKIEVEKQTLDLLEYLKIREMNIVYNP